MVERHRFAGMVMGAALVRFPNKGRESLLDVASQKRPGSLSATTPDQIDPGPFDLVVLGRREAQDSSRGVRELMDRVARAAAAKQP
jgi:hypothetical protein